MKEKLIKLSETHYIIVNDSKIKEGDWVFNYFENSIKKYGKFFADGWFKITHSTEPLEVNNLYRKYDFINIKQLSLSEVEEAIYGNSVEKMAKYHYGNHRKTREFEDGFMLGFQIAHQQLVKDKLFTVEDMKWTFESATDLYPYFDSFDDFYKTIAPKTEWDVEFINGKIKLI